MKTASAFVGARGVDSLPFSQGGTAAQARALKATGVDFFVGYLGAMNKARLAYVLDAGLAYMPVTFAGEYKDGAADEIAQLRALGIPPGTTVWLDLEGLEAWKTDPVELMRLINNWATDIKAGGWIPGLYVGAPQPLTGAELHALKVYRYWLGIGRCIDRTGKDAYPAAGWCMRQDWHGQKTGMLWKDTGVFVDTNSIQCDHLGRLPAWVVGGMGAADHEADTQPELDAYRAEEPARTVHAMPSTEPICEHCHYPFRACACAPDAA
jgi:hypothetical protein